MQLSVIIINYNTFQLTSACIESILRHTQGIDYEILLVDNASTECSAEDFQKRFPTITVLPQQTNLGFAKGNNAGIAHAKGEVILLLNSDTLLVDNVLLRAYQKIVSRQNIGVLSAKLCYPDGRIQSCCQRFPSIKLELIELLRLQKLLSSSHQARLFLGAFFDHQSEIKVDWVWGTFFMFRRDVLQKLHDQRLPDDFFMYGEDMQWCYEIKKNLGYKIVYFPEAKVIHYLSVSTSKNTSLNKQRLMVAHEYAFLKKYYGRWQADILFRLRALKYLTLSWKDKSYKPLVALYANFSE